MNEKELVRQAKKNPLLKQLRPGEYSPLDLLLTRYYPLHTRSYLEVHAQLNSAINDMPEIKWLLLTMAYWSVLGTDWLINSSNVKTGRKRFKVVEARKLDAISDNVLGVYTHKRAIYVTPIHDIVGTLIHEGVHAVVDLLYDNVSLPYPVSDKASAKYWLAATKQVLAELTGNQDRIKGSAIFTNIAKSYDESSYVEEMIARIFQHYIHFPNEDFSELTEQSRDFILKARFELAKQCRQWCMSFVRDGGLHLLPGNDGYSADISKPLYLHKEALLILQSAQKNRMSILEYQLNQLLEIKDPKEQLRFFKSIAQRVEIVDLLRVVCKYQKLTQFMLRMRDMGHDFVLDSITETNIKRGLFFAVRYGNNDVISLLLKINPDLLLSVDNDGQSIFYWLASAGQTELLKDYLAKVNRSDEKVFNNVLTQSLEGVLRYGQNESLKMLLSNYSADLQKLRFTFCPVLSIRSIRVHRTFIQTAGFSSMLPIAVEQKLLDLDSLAAIAAQNKEREKLQEILALAKERGHQFRDLTLQCFVQISVQAGWFDVVEFSHKADPDVFNKIDAMDYKLVTYLSEHTDAQLLNYLYEHHFSKPSLRPEAAIYPETMMNKDKKYPKPTNLECANEQLETAFYTLARSGNKNIKWLLSKTQYPVLSISNLKGETPLTLALAYGDSDITAICLQHKDWAQYIVGPSGKTPLLLALELGLTDVALEIIKIEPSSLVCIDDQHQSVAHYAAKVGCVAVLEKYKTLDTKTLRRGFTNRKISLDAKDNQGLSPLYVALKHGQGETARYLVKSGVAKEILDKDLVDCIKGAIGSHLDLTLLKEMIEDLVIKFQPNFPNELYSEWLSHACRANNQEAAIILIRMAPKAFSVSHLKICIEKKHSSLTKMLLKKIDPSWRNDLILHAAKCGWSEVIQWLSTGIDDINPHDDDLTSALHLASMQGHTNVVELLLMDKNVDINACNKTLRTALYCAIEQGKELTALCLLKNGSDITLCPENENTVFLLALTKQMHSVTEKIMEMIDAQAINQADQHGMTALHYAIMQSDAELVRGLLARGANINAIDAEGLTPLHIAASTQNSAMMILLKKHNADLTVKDKHGCLAAQYDDTGTLGKPKRMSSTDQSSSPKKLVDQFIAEVKSEIDTRVQDEQPPEQQPPVIQRGYQFGDITKGAFRFFKNKVVKPLLSSGKKEDTLEHGAK